MARCTGIKRDLRLDKLETYANYYTLNFRGYIGQHGDSYDRFLIRMNEMTESLQLINQIVSKIIKYNDNKVTNTVNNTLKNTTIVNPHILLKHLNPQM
jgi:NADH-quinone oxidoreductase subunit D